jgi:hypothetical protein
MQHSVSAERGKARSGTSEEATAALLKSILSELRAQRLLLERLALQTDNSG